METEQLLNKYSRHYYKELKLSGYNVTLSEVMSELGLAIAYALKSFDDTLNAKFSTYAITAFKNQIIDYRAKLNAERDEASFVHLSTGEYIDEQGLLNTAELQLIERDTVANFLRFFKGKRLVIAKEMIDPSENVQSLLVAAESKLAGKGGIKRNGTGMLAMAISKAYGIDERSVRYHIEKVKIKAKKSLTSESRAVN